MVLHLFGYFLFLLEIKTKLIKFITKFHVKHKFLPPNCNSLPLRRKLLQRNCLKFFKHFKTVRALRVNETKLTSESAFVADLSALEGEKESKCYKRTMFRGSTQTCFLTSKILSLKNAYMRFSGQIQFSAFFGYFLLLSEIKIKLIKLYTNFQER